MRNVIITFAFAITLGIAIAALLHSVHVSTLLLLNTASDYSRDQRDSKRWEFIVDFSATSINWMVKHTKLHDQINLDEGRRAR